IDKDANSLSSENAQIARMVISELQANKGLASPYASLPDVVELPQLPEDIETRPFVPGELEQGVIHTTIEDFEKRLGK
ncbi:hypothetical protein ACXWPN_10205, partial [Streptococcus pyogenes]